MLSRRHFVKLLACFGIAAKLPVAKAAPVVSGPASLFAPLPSVFIAPPHSEKFVVEVKAMLARTRRDPAHWHIMSYPLQYRILGQE